MIICHIIIGLNVGGAELMLKRLVHALDNSDTPPRQVIISLTTIGKIGMLLRESGIEIYELNINSMVSLFPVLWSLFRLIRQVNPDIIQTWMYHADFLGGLIGRLAGYKNIVWNIRTTSIAANRRTTILLRWLCAKLSGFIPRVIICAADKSRKAHVELGYCSDKMVVISNGFDTSLLQALPSDIARLRDDGGLQLGMKVIGNVGRYNYAKDQQNFICAARLIALQRPDVRFLLVGRDCDYNNSELTALIEATGFSKQFMLLGERADVPTCMAIMDVFCLSSRTEGFPNVLGEAMAMGKLCVSTDVGDAGYLLGDCGVLVASENPEELAMGVMKLLGLSASEQSVLSFNASERIRTEFTMIKAKERFESVYHELMDIYP